MIRDIIRVEYQSPNFLAPETSFMKDNFFKEQKEEWFWGILLLLQRNSPVMFVFYLFWQRLACGLTKTLTNRNAQHSDEAGMEVVNKIVGKPHKD